jgi:uncharacterized protein (DUF2267 family)
MSATGLDVFDKTLQPTHTWLDALVAEIGLDRQVAWHVLGTVLRTLRDRIPLELAIHLGSQLLVRGLYYDQWHAPGHMDAKLRLLDEFLKPIGEQLAQIRSIKARNATQAMFWILSRHVNPGQVEKVKHSLPGEVQAIWLEVTPATQVEVERAITQSDGIVAGGGRAWSGPLAYVGREGTMALALAEAGLVTGAMVLLPIKRLQFDRWRHS